MQCPHWGRDPETLAGVAIGVAIRQSHRLVCSGVLHFRERQRVDLYVQPSLDDRDCGYRLCNATQGGMESLGYEKDT